MSLTNTTSHQSILHFPKDGKPSLADNAWQAWSGSQDEGGLPDLDHGAHKVLVLFTWWLEHHHETDVITKAQNGQIGVWFAADDDILKHADVIEAGKTIWLLVAAHFPIFRDGRSFSTVSPLARPL
ncbi:hypothetical protein [Polynucleobacter necessarius]|uniref:hypothetical protein n=1 Tax=Polynucleobacter necessarius TaxID=576610 RepID=UPI0018D592C4|nr:hypothetical protein [Polynucleobacter necessarius]